MNTSFFITAVGLSAFGALAFWFGRRWLIPTDIKEIAVNEPIPIPDIADIAKRYPRLQEIGSGSGSLYNRVYSAEITSLPLTLRKLMALIQRDINAFSPQELARFEKKFGRKDSMDVGDQYHITISGPWDGPVEVVEKNDDYFTLATQQGHLEAGIIIFSVEPAPSNQNNALFKITSYARSANKLVDFAYEDVGLAKAAQTSMWMFFCNAVVEQSGGELVGDIKVETKVSDYINETA